MSQLQDERNRTHKVGNSDQPKGMSGVTKFILFVLACIVGLFLADIYIAKFPRNYLKVQKLSSMKDDSTILSAYERDKILTLMGRIRENTGLTLSFHIAELDPTPRRHGPNAFTIAISTKKQNVKYRMPYAFREMLGAAEAENFLKNLEIRYAKCLQLPIPRKVPHCLEDTMIAIEEKTMNHERASILFTTDQENTNYYVQPVL